MNLTTADFDLVDIHTHHRENCEQGGAIRSLHVDEAAAALGDGWCSVGLHPWYLQEEAVDGQLKTLERLLACRQVVAVGEGGLDRLAAAPMALQLRAFRAQVALSERYRLPLVIHCVKAVDELLAVRKQLRPQQLWIWHGFRGKPQQAVQLLQQGFYLSLGEHYSADALRVIPADRLLLETDESACGIEVLVKRAADVRGVGEDELRTTLRQNVRRLFFSFIIFTT